MTILKLWSVLYWTWVASELVILLGMRTRRSSGTVRDRGSLLVLWIVIFSSITAGIWIGEVAPHTIFNGAHWVRYAALALLVSGLVVRWTAIVQLGKSFSANVAVAVDQTILKTGLFRYVRHPSYSGLMLVFAAVGLHSRNWWGLIATVVPSVAALLYRIHVEEQALSDVFGQEYREYSSTTKRLLPGLY
jgi:protein-S-isoprenylcysteine O-methyltransferase Ste14